MANLFEKLAPSYRLFKNRDALSPHYVPSHLPFREREIEELTKRIAPVLSGRKPENIFIYGKTGTGKTAVTKKILGDLNEYARSKGLSVMGLYINGRFYESEYKVLLRMANLLDPELNLMGYTTSAVFDRIVSTLDSQCLRIVVAIDEIDTIKRVSDLIYRLNRANDELSCASLSIIGISNNPLFKEKLDARARSALCEVELVFPPYDAEQLRVILEERAKEAFKEGVVDPEAITLASAIAAKHAGDARYALQLLLRAGDIAEEEGADRVTREHVERARIRVEEDIVYEMVSTLPDQHKVLLLALATLEARGAGMESFGGRKVITSGMLYEYYKKAARSYGLTPVTDRWFREYLNELETYGIISVQVAGSGFRGNTRIIELKLDPRRLLSVLRKNL